MHLILQNANLTPFRAPIPASSHFQVLGFDPENIEKLVKNFKNL